MVTRYQGDGERRLALANALGLMALLLILVTLATEAFVIFRPMVRRVEEQFAEIERMTASLERINEDLEEQVRARTAELAAARDAAETAHKAKSRFLAHASHDLKQPLEAMGMFAGLLERHCGAQRVKELVGDLRAAHRSMRQMLDAILEISKLESGVIEPRVGATPLRPILDQIAAEFAVPCAEKELRLSAPTTSAVVLTDPALLERILRNLMSNALRYTAKGGMVIGCRPRGDMAWIEVHDTGPGIPEADRGRIFEEFVQLDRPERDRSEGIGLGLAIVDRLARLLGHRLVVRSAEGRGSVFAVGVPLAPKDDVDAMPTSGVPAPIP